MITPLTSILTAVLVLIGTAALRKAYRLYTFPLRSFGGPKTHSWITGSQHQSDIPDIILEWSKKYGRVFSFASVFNNPRVSIADPKAVAYILHNTDNYPKPDAVRYSLRRVVGPGVITVEGEPHKHQRKAMSPAFSAASVGLLVPTFIDKTVQLCEIWATECADSKDGVYRTDALKWFSWLTLDIIGLTGFNYNFRSLDEYKKGSTQVTTPFKSALDTIFSPAAFFSFVLKGYIPVLRFFPMPIDGPIRTAQEEMQATSVRLLSEAKVTGGKEARDILSILASVDSKSKDALSDSDLAAQIPTMFVAGHDTTSVLLTWAIFALTGAPEVQQKLRTTLRSIPTDSPTMEELNTLPYLDDVIREVLRLHSPVPSTPRVALRDDVVPLGEPVKDQNGKLHHTLKLRAGDTINIPILAMNVDPELWGKDALEFNPDRWAAVDSADAVPIPAVPYGSVLSFLGGPRACIGWRFALVEAKAILFTLLRRFEFELGVPRDSITSESTVVTRPHLKGQRDAGNQLPVVIRPLVEQ
ncbi:cytochrome P450 [Cylindrobasidium torrendii FP15055 ss-10]|uniref:Cytochrome P450 n=1 Tax=Cylindrobasidium torrendii FP15055 ss-10 TaxID=1314674 RepID=A0A0D7B783_9AGAR|nr:cytochrome P450 [Cylindrobasidium torrendii FP15055 ss-10]